MNTTNSNGPVVSIIVVIIVLIVGAFYFFTRISEIQNTPNPLDTQEEFATTSESNDVSAIETDLEAENFDDIDAELRTLDAEFGQ